MLSKFLLFFQPCNLVIILLHRCHHFLLHLGNKITGSQTDIHQFGLAFLHLSHCRAVHGPQVVIILRPGTEPRLCSGTLHTGNLHILLGNNPLISADPEEDLTDLCLQLQLPAIGLIDDSQIILNRCGHVSCQGMVYLQIFTLSFQILSVTGCSRLELQGAELVNFLGICRYIIRSGFLGFGHFFCSFSRQLGFILKRFHLTVERSEFAGHHIHGISERLFAFVTQRQ